MMHSIANAGMQFTNKCLAVEMQKPFEIETGLSITAGLGRNHALIRVFAWAVSSFPSASLAAGQARLTMSSSDSLYHLCW
jgi:hypothetical protein